MTNKQNKRFSSSFAHFLKPFFCLPLILGREGRGHSVELFEEVGNLSDDLFKKKVKKSLLVVKHARYCPLSLVVQDRDEIGRLTFVRSKKKRQQKLH